MGLSLKSLLSTASLSKASNSESVRSHLQLYIKVGNYKGRMVAVKEAKTANVALSVATLRDLKLVRR